MQSVFRTFLIMAKNSRSAFTIGSSTFDCFHDLEILPIEHRAFSRPPHLRLRPSSFYWSPSPSLHDQGYPGKKKSHNFRHKFFLTEEIFVSIFTFVFSFRRNSLFFASRIFSRRVCSNLSSLFLQFPNLVNQHHQFIIRIDFRDPSPLPSPLKI